VADPKKKRILRRPRAALAAFLETEASGGIILFAAAVVGMLWANVGPDYDGFWHTTISVAGIERDLQHWVNDGLMTVFFFVVGLEIKRELVTGELRDPRVAALPVAAAIGGMAVPALVYVSISGGGPAAAGWAIPMATDIAFVVGALALLGSRVPSGLKLFLLTLAIVDDIGAILVIALAYSDGIDPRWLGVAALAFGTVVVLHVARVPYPSAYLLPGLLAWAAMLSSGVHPTIAGVALGLITPARPVRERHVLEDLERWLHPVSSYFVVPVFALANAGLVVTLDFLKEGFTSRVFWAVVLGLVVGKTVGIAGASAAARRLGLARPPVGVSSRHIRGGAALAGIGFTVSLFIAGLAFEKGPLADHARMGILVGSMISALTGGVALARRRDGARKQS
jgi:NhaA family Na+:H+ antiporter